MVFILVLLGLSQELPEGAGKETVLKLCQDCHGLATVTMDNRTKDGWKKTIEKMNDRGLEGTDEQFTAVIDYLTKNFGRININKALAEEIAMGIGFPPEESAAIVKYREKNGDFKDWRDLKKVVDADRVEAKKDHIAVR